MKGGDTVINAKELKAQFTRRGYTQGQVQRAIGIKSQSTMSKKLRLGTFTLPECEKMIELLEISNPQEIFFPTK